MKMLGLQMSHMRVGKGLAGAWKAGDQLHPVTDLLGTDWCALWESSTAQAGCCCRGPAAPSSLFRGVTSWLCIAKSTPWLEQVFDCTAVRQTLQKLLLRASPDGSMPIHSAAFTALSAGIVQVWQGLLHAHLLLTVCRLSDAHT